jgi:UDPglucose 6-dehydrogenase
MDAARAMTTGVAFCTSAEAAAEGAEALVIVTEWEAFRALDFSALKQTMARPLLVDLRNVYSAEHVEPYGFSYVGVGRPRAKAGTKAMAAE